MTLFPQNIKQLPVILTNFLQKFPDKSKIVHDPFRVRLNEETGRWIPPLYSLRRQADLKKSAERYGVLDLLPAFPEFDRRLLRKKPFKGHKWERTREERKQRVSTALAQMPKTIDKWKEDKAAELLKNKSSLPF